MKRTLPTFIQKLTAIAILVLSFSVTAQNIPFNCDYSAYLFQYNDVYVIDLASGNSFLAAEDITSGNINAAAYNPADGFIWGYLSTPSNTIVRIGKDFQTTSFVIPELTTGNKYVGDISPDGIYYFKAGGTTYFKVDLNPNSPTYTQYLSTETLSQSLSIHDWAFNAVDGNLYAVEKNSNILYRINPTTNVVESLGEVPILAGLKYTYGAVYFDADGRFYVSANQTGTIYVIQSVQDLTPSSQMSSNLFAFGPSSASNDGARCPTAPVLQEICDNGIDDDGDGLIDCDDPSCSGFGSCAVIPAPTTANDGGLESNGRLSEAINKRNFNRAKNSYKFDQKSARRVTKDSSNTSVNRAASNTTFQLQDFVPLTTINEDYAVDSTPQDLLNITNATEVYSVDYMQNNASIASVLALKTENGVYEHTKYICDRLLGGELISVSTMDINGQAFIKSIIKNVDGSFEYVLSLSAKLANNDANFAIESHWNLDLYEENVTFYNFQIWSDSIDDLYSLAEEVLILLDAEKAISGYQLSTPPTVFVRKGKYNNGALDLQIINTNATGNVGFDSGYRVTETSDFNYSNSTIDLNQDYITELEVSTGNLFDIGFRIGDGINTPDDLFMSDGPWGVDDSEANTTVNSYLVSPNTTTFDSQDFPIERNVTLNATTDTYVAAYRALTPRFKAVDLNDFTSFKFKAKGTGNLEITLVKQSITNWDEQYKTTIALTDSYQSHAVLFSEFTSTLTPSLEANDIVTIVFTMQSEDGSVTTKQMDIQDVRFSRGNDLSVNDFETETVNTLIAYPNPMIEASNLHFTSQKSENVELIIYNQLGKIVYKTSVESLVGNNIIPINSQNLSSGLYICKLSSTNTNYKPLKLLVK
ncbi:T9SS type A sorting domain-containing protein [Olleya sp. YSTF-M6]|uniref:T9SS type A sorting domain-containing protein n=1 Tax=Olleya sediminilitoris TaxID=2795739 RepID=A0ABS1WM47_9FLAO|nr:T9SS type A sorting domain-containing protein [Olleya sediminilitoris]MBL7560207.1 T9SS type A sorting domain-containing protein [Olleya sediminilitoris]